MNGTRRHYANQNKSKGKDKYWMVSLICEIQGNERQGQIKKKTNNKPQKSYSRTVTRKGGEEGTLWTVVEDYDRTCWFGVVKQGCGVMSPPERDDPVLLNNMQCCKQMLS